MNIFSRSPSRALSPAHRVRLRRPLAIGAVLLFATAADAVPNLVGRLAPDTELAMPNAKTKAPKVSVEVVPGCPTSLPPRTKHRPFKPGEVLEFEADIFGYEVAVLESRVEPLIKINGALLLPIYAEVHSDFMLRMVASFDAEMRTWVDPKTLKPQRHAWRMRALTPKVDYDARSDAAFSADGKIGLKHHSVVKEFGKPQRDERDETVFATAPGVLDFLSVIYDARVRELKVGTVLCSSVQLVSSVGAMKGVVVGRERVDVDYDERMAFKILITDGVVRKEEAAYKVSAWISDDRERLPLRLLIENDQGAIDLELDDVDR